LFENWLQKYIKFWKYQAKGKKKIFIHWKEEKFWEKNYF